jgi:glycosyltransferase involved in cell wall biosynthesis
MTEISNRDFVIVGLQPWYIDLGCNAKDIAYQLALKNRVLYINAPIKRKIYLAGKDPNFQKHLNLLKNQEDQLSPISKNLWEFYPSCLTESANWLPSTRLFRLVNYYNNRRYAREIRKACSRLGFKDIILLNDNDPYNGFYLKKLLRPSLYIYYMRDFLQGFDYWRKHTSILEPELIRKSDIVVANSTYFEEYTRSINNNTFYIGQGCNLQAFDPEASGTPPQDIQQLTRPIIGYVGALNSSRLDHAIIRSVATENPHWNIVLVGPEDDNFKQSDLHQLPNVLFTGSRPFSELASYVNAFDVCINPQYNNIITRGNYPLKIDEYLAMGKPVVATRTTAMKLFETHTYLADTPTDYTPLIKKALENNNPTLAKERIRFAKTHTWENSVAGIYRAIAETNKKDRS